MQTRCQNTQNFLLTFYTHQPLEGALHQGGPLQEAEPLLRRLQGDARLADADAGEVLPALGLVKKN